MKEDQSGLLINNVSPVSAAHSLLKRDDVILSIDGTKLANDSTIIFRNTGERIAFEYLLTQKFVGDSCELEILRNGQVQKVTVKTIERPNLVPPVSYDTKPSYFVFAGLVFEKFVQPYLHENGEGKNFVSIFDTKKLDWYNNSPRRLCHKAIYGEIKEVDEEVVILAHVLIDEINYGYGDLTYAELSKFNGTRVKNLKHLAEMIDKNTQEYFKFEFSEHP